jgi:acyl-CoA thioesterase|tara:strand:- start:2750 stop:3124 length:375 start_codon:yes stop_codon:yes gene_type:complete
MQYRKDFPYADLMGLEIQSIESGMSICKIPFKKDLLNPNDVVHGGVIYSIADTGMGAAVFSTLEDGEFCATLEIKIMYLKPAGHFDLICHTQVIKKGRRVAFLESEILSNKELIAKASGSFAIF